MNADVNLVAVLIAAVAQMFLGFLWYGPLFGKQWMKLVGMTAKDMENAKGAMAKTYTLSFLGALVMAYVLGVFVDYVGALTAVDGAKVGFLAWLGFVATTGANQYIYAVKPKPWTLYLLDQGYLLVGLKVMGAILAAWV